MSDIKKHRKDKKMNKKKFSVLKRISMLSAVIMLTLTAAFSLTACGKSNIPENTVFSAEIIPDLYEKKRELSFIDFKRMP